MKLLSPFRGLRPVTERVADVIAPPYDVVNTAEARELARNKPWSFLHVSKPEIDLPEDTDPYDESVYQRGAENFARMIDQGILIRDQQPCFYIYELTMGEHVQTGIAAAASIEAYDSNVIRKHEFTRPVKEDDRVRQIKALRAQTGPVFLTYRQMNSVDGTGGNAGDDLRPIVGYRLGDVAQAAHLVGCSRAATGEQDSLIVHPSRIEH